MVQAMLAGFSTGAAWQLAAASGSLQRQLGHPGGRAEGFEQGSLGQGAAAASGSLHQLQHAGGSSESYEQMSMEESKGEACTLTITPGSLEPQHLHADTAGRSLHQLQHARGRSEDSEQVSVEEGLAAASGSVKQQPSRAHDSTEAESEEELLSAGGLQHRSQHTGHNRAGHAETVADGYHIAANAQTNGRADTEGGALQPSNGMDTAQLQADARPWTQTSRRQATQAIQTQLARLEEQVAPPALARRLVSALGSVSLTICLTPFILYPPTWTAARANRVQTHITQTRPVSIALLLRAEMLREHSPLGLRGSPSSTVLQSHLLQRCLQGYPPTLHTSGQTAGQAPTKPADSPSSHPTCAGAWVGRRLAGCRGSCVRGAPGARPPAGDRAYGLPSLRPSLYIGP